MQNMFVIIDLDMILRVKLNLGRFVPVAGWLNFRKSVFDVRYINRIKLDCFFMHRVIFYNSS